MYIAKLHPYAFKFGPIGVHWYGIFMVMAIIGGSYYLLERAKQWGADPDKLSSVVLWTVIWGVIGARVVFVLANDPQWIWTDPLQTLKIWQGGLAIDGAMGFGLLAFWYQLRKQPVLFNHIMDWSVPGLALGIFMVRIGNIFDHQVLGRMTELGFGRWPEQLWGSFIGVFLITRYFWLERNKAVPPGYQFWSAMFYYAILRGFIGETTRDNPLYIWHYINPHWGIGFTTLMQLFTPPILVFTGLMMRRTWRQSAKTLPEIFQQQPATVPSDYQTFGLPGRTLLRWVGVVSGIGAVIFLLIGVPSIGWYLIGAGAVFEAFTIGWRRRYDRVYDQPPPEYAPTGELYVNPGGAHPVVAVWQKGIHRVYVKAPRETVADASKAHNRPDDSPAPLGADTLPGVPRP
jgi:phosphatidylglycerol:prolipoprotein diacylglycerol transferase